MGKRREIYAIDFDGTLCANDNYPNIGAPNIKLIEHLKRLKEDGQILILWTCRGGKSLEDAVEWCKSYGLEFDYVNDNAEHMVKFFGNNNRKIFANYYIDDRMLDYSDYNVPFKE